MATEIEHQPDCVFCRELAGSRDTNFSRRYPELSSRIVGKTASLVAFPCIGQLAAGHFLIVPKFHDTTFRETLRRTADLQLQIDSISKHVHSLLEADIHDSLYFEHGAGSAADGGCGIYHAHIHVVPNAGHINLAQHFPNEACSRSNSPNEALDSLRKEGPYILFGSPTQGFFCQSLEKALPSQTLRRLVANELQGTRWDWREAGREVGLFELVQRALSS